jgi:hypothetical protein
LEDDGRKPRKSSSKGTKKSSGKKKKATPTVTSSAPAAPVRATEESTDLQGSGRVSATAAMFEPKDGDDAKPFKFY